MFTGQWQNRANRLDAYKPYLDQRWQEGCTNAWRLWEEIKEQGHPCGYASVRDYVSRNLRGKPATDRPPARRRPAPSRAGPSPPEGARLQLKAVLANCPEPTALSEHVRSFGHMVARLQGDRLPTWIEAATSTTDLPSLRPFAQHLERDLDAVIAGLALPWNSGAVEGHGNRIIMWNLICQARAVRCTQYQGAGCGYVAGSSSL
ncbi:hypothetical protein [Streptomyces sp. NPDC058382]|uniref:hypothetical protein n=1 Tax=unclassified Streptomyces TaxID=2593676 RepID=UPI0036311933